MSDFRVRYGMALSQYGAASAVSGGMQLPIDDATPDVTDGTLFLTANTGATTITYFDVRGPGGLTSLNHNGKLITLLINDNLTTIANAGQLFLSGTGGAMTTGQTISFTYYNSAWYELGVSKSAGGRESVKTVTVSVTANQAPNVAGVEVLLVNPTTGATVVGLSGGVGGQQVVVMQGQVTASSSLTLTGAANFQLAGTGSFLANASAAYVFVNDGTRFRQVGGILVP